VWLQLEHERNMEDPGCGAEDVRDDITLLELFTGF